MSFEWDLNRDKVKISRTSKVLRLITNRFEGSPQFLHICTSHQVTVIKTFIMGTMGASIQAGIRRNGDNSLFPFLKFFFCTSDVGKWNLKRGLTWARMCTFPKIFSDKWHLMLQRQINIIFSITCFEWLRIQPLLAYKAGKNRKVMHSWFAYRSILNDNHLLIHSGS